MAHTRNADAMRKISFVLILFLLACPVLAADGTERSVGVFVALCDNKHQGIVPVPAKIGNGDNPEENLYWGCSEGLKGHFDRSSKWKLVTKVDRPDGDILRTRTYRHRTRKATLHALAYRGRAIQKCIADFENAVYTRKYDLVVYIGHNGLMDFNLPEPKTSEPSKKRPACIALCCKSAPYFRSRIQSMGAQPILLTTQLMYPGSFIVHDVIEEWLKGASLRAIRNCAARSYARNQKISEKTARGVFANLEAVMSND